MSYTNNLLSSMYAAVAVIFCVCKIRKWLSVKWRPPG